MKLLLLATAFVVSVSGVEDVEWNRYKMAHKKVYTTREEDTRRLEQYVKNKKMVEEHNERYRRGETSYTMAINQFSDWFPEEIQPQRDFKLDVNTFRGKEFELPTGTPIPNSINWVEKGAVTKVKTVLKHTQTPAFSAAGALEALMFIKNKTITDLSAQEIIDCVVLNTCPFMTFLYVEQNGLLTNASYPYTGKKECCLAQGTPVVHCSGFIVINNEEDLTKAVALMGPVAVLFCAHAEFLQYQGGIYDGPCSNEFNFSMLAVGYGTDKKTKTDYWLLKNAFGEDWGEKGYARVKRNVDKCSIQVAASIPIYI